MPNATRGFPPGVNLGEYVYALRDPRDKHIFYVGKGNGDRLFAHFWEAEGAIAADAGWTDKLQRIADIWAANLDVDWWVVRHNLQGGPDNPVTAFDVESAIIEILAISPNGEPLNEIAGHGYCTHGIRSPTDIAMMAAEPVNPNQPYPSVFLFPITNALARGATPYDATRREWAVSPALRNTPNALAVGISDRVSRAVFTIDRWAPVAKKWEFSGRDISSEHHLYRRNWGSVIATAKGYWQRGQYLVIELDGDGRFRFKRGSKNKGWQSLIRTLG